MTDNKESISDKLRRLSAEECNFYCKAAGEYGIECYDMPCSSCRRLLMMKIADEIDREMDELCEQFSDSPLISPMQAVSDIAKGKDKHPLLKEAIDHYYLPRPLFEDGEPVQFGDEIEHPDSGKTCSVNSIHVFEDGYFAMTLHGDSTSAIYEVGKCVKRPKQPVLDADGVPIEVGDRVYLVPGKHCENFPLNGYKAGVE